MKEFGLMCACISIMLTFVTAFLDVKRKYRTAIKTGLVAMIMGLTGVITSIIALLGGL